MRPLSDLFSAIFQRNRPLLEGQELQGSLSYLVEPFADFPVFKPDWTIVAGQGALSGLAAFHAARLAKEDRLGQRVVFVGGKKPNDDYMADTLIKDLKKCGIPRPVADETETLYMLRAFQKGLHSHGMGLTFNEESAENGKLNASVGKTEIYADLLGSTQTMREKMQLARDLAWKKEFQSVGLICAPAMARRMMGSFKACYKPDEWWSYGGQKMVFSVTQIWEPAINLVPETCRENQYVLYIIKREGEKIGFPGCKRGAPYISSGEALYIEPIEEYIAAKGYLRRVNNKPLRYFDGIMESLTH